MKEDALSFSKIQKIWRSELYSSSYIHFSAVTPRFPVRPEVDFWGIWAPMPTQGRIQRPKKEIGKWRPEIEKMEVSGNMLLEPKVDLNTGSDRKSRRCRTKMKITLAAELRSSNFLMFWKAETILLNLSTTFMGVTASLLYAKRLLQTRAALVYNINDFILIKENHSYILKGRFTGGSELFFFGKKKNKSNHPISRQCISRGINASPRIDHKHRPELRESVSGSLRPFLMVLSRI